MPTKDAGLHLRQQVGSYHAQELKRIRDLTGSKLDVCEYISKEWHWFLRQGPAPPTTLPNGLDHFFGDDAVAAFASLNSSQDETKVEINLLREELEGLESMVKIYQESNAQILKLLDAHDTHQ